MHFVGRCLLCLILCLVALVLILSTQAAMYFLVGVLQNRIIRVRCMHNAPLPGKGLETKCRDGRKEKPVICTNIATNHEVGFGWRCSICTSLNSACW
ncbi:hypothetical protein HDK77DRAFT_438270 [Phyllosticta capitalensis]